MLMEAPPFLKAAFNLDARHFFQGENIYLKQLVAVKFSLITEAWVILTVKKHRN